MLFQQRKKGAEISINLTSLGGIHFAVFYFILLTDNRLLSLDNRVGYPIDIKIDFKTRIFERNRTKTSKHIYICRAKRRYRSTINLICIDFLLVFFVFAFRFIATWHCGPSQISYLFRPFNICDKIDNGRLKSGTDLW